MTPADLLERLQPSLAVLGEILVDLFETTVERRLAELRPAPAPPGPAGMTADERAELVAAVIAELRAGAIEHSAPVARVSAPRHCRICGLAALYPSGACAKCGAVPDGVERAP